MKKTTKNTAMHKLLVSVSIVIGLSSVLPSAFAWGPNREVYTYEDINSDYLAGTWPKNKIVFNSITNTPNFGDERNFVSTREYNGDDNGFDNVWNGNDITVKDGQEYKIRLYVHNNSPWGYEGVATDVRVSFSIPTISAKQVQVNGFVYSDNAEQEQIWDYVNFNSDHAFHLEYVYGSALLGNSGIGNPENGKTTGLLGYELSDEVVTKSGGTLIGYDAIDGCIPGGYDYVSYVTISVKAVFDYDLTLDSSVRYSNRIGKTWENTVDVNVGDKVDIQLQYQNTSDAVQKGVAMRVVLPDGLRYVEGSGQLINSSHPEGAPLEGSYIVTDGIAIGNYEPNASAQIILTVEATDDGLSDTLVSLAQVGIESLEGQNGAFIMQDSVQIIIKTQPPYMMAIPITIIVVCLLAITLIRCYRIRKKTNR